MAKKINPTRTDIRLPPEEIPKEILPLVEAVNQALDRLEVGFRVQREFTADAAHELRTPPTILRSRIHALADGAITKALQKHIEGMARIDSELPELAELDPFSNDPQAKPDL